MKRDLTFDPKGGQLAVALGIDKQRAAMHEEMVEKMIAKNWTMEQIITHMNELDDLTDAEWTCFMFSLGHFDARVRG